MTTPDTRIATPQRTCIGCRQTRPQHELVRCAFGAHGAHVGRNLAGRGAWLCSMRCCQTAMRRNAFERSWRRSLSSAELQQLGDELRVAFDEDPRELSRKG